jgi:hypothetical protein
MQLMNHQRRENAIRLLALFVSTGVPSGAVMRNAWVLDLATQNGLDDQVLLSGLNYAAEQNWLELRRKGLSLTEAGKAATTREANSQSAVEKDHADPIIGSPSYFRPPAVAISVDL